MEYPTDGDTIIRETAEAAKREMEFYKELRKRRNAIAIWKPKAELTAQQALAYEQSTCDPVLREVAKSILEEIQYNRNERSMGYRIAIYVMVFSIATMIIIFLIIYFSVRGSIKPKSKY